jgi:hypothetical protein
VDPSGGTAAGLAQQPSRRIETSEELAAPADEQHNDLRWWSPLALLEADDVHPNTTAYFIRICGSKTVK